MFGIKFYSGFRLFKWWSRGARRCGSTDGCSRHLGTNDERERRMDQTLRHSYPQWSVWCEDRIRGRQGSCSSLSRVSERCGGAQRIPPRNMSVRTFNLGLPSVRCITSASAGTSLRSFPLNRLAHRGGLCLAAGCLDVGVSGESQRLRVLCFSSKSPDSSLDLPLLPFQPDEVLILRFLYFWTLFAYHFSSGCHASASLM